MDIRQTKQWGKYLAGIGWLVEEVGGIQVFIKKIPIFNSSVIKIQHHKNPLPFTMIDKLAKKYNAICVIAEPENKRLNLEDFKKAGYFNSPMLLTHTSTIYIDLTQSEKKLWNSLSENARRNIKKAQKNNLIIKKVWTKDGNYEDRFKLFFKLFKNLTKLKKFWTPGFDEYFKKLKAFEKCSILFFAYTKNSPEPIATIWVSYFNNIAVYINTGITEDGYGHLANYLLVWEAFKTCKKLGVKTFDFEGIYDPRFPKEKKTWVNFSEFKKRFHGTLIEYPKPQMKCYNLFFKLFFLCSKVLSRS